MGKILRLTESELIDVIKKVVIEEQNAYAAGKAAGQQQKQAVKGAIKKGVQVVKNATGQVIKIGKTVIKFYITGVICVFIIAGKAFKLAVELGKKIVSFLASLSKKFNAMVIGQLKAAANLTTAIVTGASTSIATLLGYIFNALKSLGMKVYAAALQVAAKIGDIWKYISNWATSALKSAYNAVKGAATSAYNTVKKGVSDTWNAAKGYVSGWLSESTLETILEDYNYYLSLPLKKMLNEIHFDNRMIIY